MIVDLLGFVVFIVFFIATATILISTLIHQSRRGWSWFLFTLLSGPISFIVVILYWIDQRNEEQDKLDKNLKGVIEWSLLIIFILVLVWVVTAVIIMFSSSTSQPNISTSLIASSINKTIYVNRTDSTNTESSLFMNGFTYEFYTCVQDKLKAKGYDDKIDCIENYNYTLCQDISRYNAEVNAKNECNGYT